MYKINGDKYKQCLPGPSVTLSDFKSLVEGKNKYELMCVCLYRPVVFLMTCFFRYFFEVRDVGDPEPYFAEFRDDHDILPIYNGRIVGRVRPLKID